MLRPRHRRVIVSIRTTNPRFTERDLAQAVATLLGDYEVITAFVQSGRGRPDQFTKTKVTSYSQRRKKLKEHLTS